MRWLCHFVFILALACWKTGIGQTGIDSAYLLYSKGNLESAARAYVKVRDEAKASGAFGEYFTAYGMYIDCLHKTGALRSMQREILEYDQSRLNAARSLNESQKASTQLTSDMFHVLLADARGDLSGAVRLLETVSDSLLAVPEASFNTRIRQFKTLQQLADTYYRMGNYETAKGYATQALNTPQEFRMRIMDDGLALTPHLILSEIHTQLADYDAATAELETVLSLLAFVEERQMERYITTLEKLVQLAIRRGDLQEARQYLSELSLFDPNGLFALRKYRLEGEISYAAGEYTAARNAYQRASYELASDGDFTSDDKGIIDLELGKISLALSHPAEADSLLNQGLRCFGKRDGTLAAEDLFDHLAVIDLLYYASLAEEELGMTHQAWETIKVGIQYVEGLRATYNTAEDRAKLIDKSYTVFERALSLCSAFHIGEQNDFWAKEAFALIERSKGLNLRDAINRANAARSAGIPDSLALQETEITAALEEVKSQIRSGRRSGAPTDTMRVLEFRRFSLEKSLDSLHSAIAATYPAYRPESAVSDVEGSYALAASLGSDQMILDFFEGGTALFAVGITADGYSFHQLDSSAHIDRMVESYRDGIQSYINGKTSADLDRNFLTASYELYHSLLQPFEPLAHDLIIIPDGSLNQLSFAGLIRESTTENEDLRSLSYLVLEHDISYCYSVALLNTIASEHSDRSGGSLIFAPEIDPKSTFAPLPFAITEAEEVQRITSGQAFLGNECSASNVRKQLRKNRSGSLIHLATHGSADITYGADSFLQFTGSGDSSRIYAYELYSIPLSYDLVYLSACETGSGSNQSGEGVYSLARAFFYAGANSLVTALWNIGDASSGEMTKRFYKRLRSGSRIHTAVAHAQREYLMSLEKTDRYLAHPAFWSSVVVYGDPYVRPAGSSRWHLAILLLMASTVALIIFFLRRR